VKTLGRGGQAIVNLHKAKNSDEQLFAIKTYKIHHPEMYKQIYREIKCLRELDICHNIVQLDSVY
jgi:serine/threonine protein kinase